VGALCTALGCTKRDGEQTSTTAPSAAAPSAGKVVAASSAAPVATATTTVLPAIDACAFTAADVSKALGSTYGAGKALPAIPGVPTSSCAYDGKGSQLRVNVTPYASAIASAMRKDVGQGLAGKLVTIPGDADGAVLQFQSGDLATCALHYLRGDVKYEVRLMTCREPEASARAKLTALPRP
jgi:hypothetical protein